MRIAGAALILAAFVAAGLGAVGGKKRRIGVLRSLTGALERMEGELDTRVTPLPELCRLLSADGGQAGAFFAAVAASLDRLDRLTFSQLWREAGEACLGALEPEEREELDRLGQILGRYALPEQTAAIRACRAALRGRLEAAERAYPEQRRLSLGLGASAGLLLIIVLL